MKTRAKVDSTKRSGTDEGLAVLSTLIGGFVVWGGIGWLLDLWWGTKFLTPVGLIVGMALGIYAVVARNGPVPPPSTKRPTDLERPSPASDPRENECP